MKKRGIVCMVSTIILATFTQAQSPPAAPLREVGGQTLISNELPRAELTFAKEFRYVGGQDVTLYGMVDAEQHIFVVAGAGSVVERFYWVQFEHRLPTDKHTYRYQGRTTDISGFSFIYDTRSWPDYAANNAVDPGSDGAAIGRLLAEHSLRFPDRVARVRMFHLPTPDRRSELMIIYGEALPDGSDVPVRPGGVVLDEEAPAAALTLLEHARRDVTIRKP